MKELWKELENVLERHSGLKVSLCHFLFMSPDLEGAADFLDRYPNATLDLSLGVELMYNISRRRDDYREFFRTRAEFHSYDEADELLTRYELPFIGLDLPDSCLKKIYSGNFKRMWGEKPSLLNP
jgi:hypothetical protein